MSRAPNFKANRLRQARANARGYLPGHERGELSRREVDQDLSADFDEERQLLAETRARGREEWEFTSRGSSAEALKTRVAALKEPRDPKLEALWQQALLEPPDDGVPCPSLCGCRKHEGAASRFLRLLAEQDAAGVAE